jgi:hypothetical protein
MLQTSNHATAASTETDSSPLTRNLDVQKLAPEGPVTSTTFLASPQAVPYRCSPKKRPAAARIPTKAAARTAGKPLQPLIVEDDSKNPKIADVASFAAPFSLFLRPPGSMF